MNSQSEKENENPCGLSALVGQIDIPFSIETKCISHYYALNENLCLSQLWSLFEMLLPSMLTQWVVDGNGSKGRASILNV